MAEDGGSVSTEHTVSDAVAHAPSPAALAAAPISLSTAHHFVSLKLNTKNFLFWRTQLVPFLRGQNLLGFVDGTNPCPSPTTGPPDALVLNPTYGSWVQQDQSILSMLVSSLSEEVMHLAVGRTTSKQVWDAITQSLGSTTRARALRLLGQLQALRQGDSTVTEYLGRAQVIVEELALAGRPVSLDEQNLYVFRGLRAEYRAMASSLTTQDNPISLGALSDVLAAQEFIHADDLPGGRDAAGPPTAMAATRGGGRAGGQRGSGGRGRWNNRRGQRGGGSGRGRGGGVRCQICSGFGHTAVSCYRRYSEQPPQAHVAAAGRGGSTVHGGSPGGGELDHGVWLPDTGATNHATPDLSALSIADEYYGDDVLRVGNGSGLPINSIGHASFSTPARSFSMSNILHVPNLSASLLSVHKFASENKVFFEFHPDFFVVKDSITKEVLLRGPNSNGLYTLPVRKPAPVALVSSRASSSVWHNRLGHPHGRVLRQILKDCSVSSSSNLDSLCGACQLGKSSRFPLPRVVTRSRHVLDLVFTDIWGPAPVLSSTGSRYFVLFVDDYTRFMWLYPLRLKTDIYAAFDKFRALVENQFSCKIKAIQSDLGGEYKKLHSVFSKLGISHRQSCAYTHEQNGRVERRNRHVVETGLSLMAQASVPSRFWDYAFETAVFLINRMPTSVLNDVSPYQLVFQSPPTYDFLRVFGCLCYPFLRPYRKHKMDFRSAPCVFLGYPNSFRGYRCMDLTTKKVFICRHVRFDEGIFPFVKPKQSLSQVVSQNGAASPWAVAPMPSRVTEAGSVSSPPVPVPVQPSKRGSKKGARQKQPVARTHSMTLRHMTRAAAVSAPAVLAAQVQVSDPTCFTQAVKFPEWREAMDAELNALMHNQTWRLVPFKPGMNVVGCKWVFRTKRKADGSIERHKARLVAKGFNQVAGQDFFDTFSPVVKPTTVRLLLSLAISSNWVIRQLDVHNAFLNGNLSETVYMRQPPGYVDDNHPTHVCLLQRSLYGLKQAPRAWFTRLHNFLLQVGFCASKTDVSLFVYTQSTSRVYLLVYVDDILVMGNDAVLVENLLKKLSAEFKIRDLGYPSFFLGIETVRCGDGLLLSQKKYMCDILKRAGMTDCKPLATPVPTSRPMSDSAVPFDDPTKYRSLAGALQYLTITRPDLAYAVNLLCQNMHAPTESHWAQLKRVLRYVKGTLGFGLRIRKSCVSDLHGFSDSDWAGCPKDRKSTSGFAVFMGTNLISWVCRKQRTVARSSTEAEYKALADVSAELTWVTSLLRELGIPFSVPKLWCDNLGATYMCANPVFHARTKHVEIDYHFVRDKVSKGELQVNFISTKDQLADIFTKPLATSRFIFIRDKLQISNRDPQLEGEC